MKPGRIDVFCGPMFSGKSEELIRQLRRAVRAGRKVIVFKPDIDTRSGEVLVSHSAMEWPAINVSAKDPSKILELVSNECLIGIDEAQFFEAGLISICEKLADQGHHVIVAGLDQDFLGQPFGIMPSLMALADQVTKLTAICPICGREAPKSQRISDTTSTVEIGAEDKYAPRCRLHFVKP